MPRDRLHFLFLNIGHFIDHYATLIFATVAALALTKEWGMSYADLAVYGTPGFLAFGLFSYHAGRLGDRWSRDGMMAVFFLGIGVAAIVTSFAQSPLQIAIGLFVVGMFAAIYHPVGLAMVVTNYAKSGWALALNGVWGNLGVACAALVTAFFIDNGGWRAAFLIPGVLSVVVGLAYCRWFWAEVTSPNKPAAKSAAGEMAISAEDRGQVFRVTVLMFLIITMSGFIFQSTTFALPKVFEERLGGITYSVTSIGWMAFLVFTVASFAQLVVGTLLDRMSTRTVFLVVAASQVFFFALMPGLTNWWAMLVALGFMIGAFGQLPITDFIVGKLAKSELRSTIFGARYVVTCLVFASAIPLIAWIHREWGFDTLFKALSIAAGVMFLLVLLLPGKLPEPKPVTQAA